MTALDGAECITRQLYIIPPEMAAGSAGFFVFHLYHGLLLYSIAQEKRHIVIMLQFCGFLYLLCGKGIFRGSGHEVLLPLAAKVPKNAT